MEKMEMGDWKEQTSAKDNCDAVVQIAKKYKRL